MGPTSLLQKLRSFSERSNVVLDKLAITEAMLRQEEEQLRSEERHNEDQALANLNFAGGASPTGSLGVGLKGGPGGPKKTSHWDQVLQDSRPLSPVFGGGVTNPLLWVCNFRLGCGFFVMCL